ncbi:MAG: DNA polymerase IV [Lachnospiraceae bacterium]|nr:DNA polymerase IV [Lachnospiraceae bacterium]
MEPIIFHIDVNSAYLSWTALERLSQGDPVDLRLIPSIIGGDMERRHGVVLAKSLSAKSFGIVTGEPVVNALKKCPQLVMASPDHSLYTRRSKALMNFLSDICPDIEQASIDECYMDFTSVAHLYSSPIEAALSIKDEIYHRFGFTVNIGISDKKVLAKMASDFKKPNLVHTLYTREIAEKLWPLPVSSLFMCGHSSVDTLKKLEILTIGELAKTDPAILASHLKSHGMLLWNYANGIDDSIVIAEPVKRKGVGNSVTLGHDVTQREEAAKTLLSLAESVGKSLRAENESAGLVCVEIKYSTFQSVSHQTTLQTPTASTETIYRTALSLFDAIWSQHPIRLLGIRTSHLTEADEPVQLSLFDGDSNQVREEKQKKLDAALDSIRNRYGSSSIVRGSLLSAPEAEKGIGTDS